VNGEIRETQGGIMTGLDTESQTERMLLSEDAVSNHNQISHFLSNLDKDTELTLAKPEKKTIAGMQHLSMCL